MIAAAIATMATVEAATTTRAFCLAAPAPKLSGERNCPRPRNRKAEAGEHRPLPSGVGCSERPAAVFASRRAVLASLHGRRLTKGHSY